MKTAIIKASDITKAQYILRKKFKHSKIVTYKFLDDFKYIEKEKRNYKQRKMKVVFIEDYEKFKEEWLK